MNLGIGLGVATSYLPIPAVALDPDAVIAALFSSGEEGAWYDPSDSSTVWQDAAGTTPAGVGDPVGRIDDKSGNGNHATQTTSAARPVLQSSGGLYYLDFDGVDDFMAVTFAATEAQPNSIGVGFKFDAYAVNQYDFVYDSPKPTTPYEDRHALFDNTGSLNFSAGSALTLASSTTSETVSVSTYNTTSSSGRINGVEVVTGNAGSWVWGGVVLGASFLYHLYANARIYSFVGVNRTLTAGEISDLESYLATKSGVTI